MFLTINLNPYIEKRYKVGNIGINKNIKVNDYTYATDNHGVVSSIILNMFKERTFLTGFLGGLNGKYYHEKLLELKIAHDFVPIKEETRAKIFIEGGENYIKMYEESPRIIRDDILNFLHLYSKLIEKSSIIYGASNELSPGIPEDIYYNLIKIAKDKNKRFILNAKSLELKKAIEASPYMVILDKEQLEYLTGIKLELENEIIKASRYLLDRGVEFLVIDISKNETLVLCQDKGYRLELFKEEDLEFTSKENGLFSMPAGFILGINRQYSMDMTLSLVQAIKTIVNLENDISKIEMSQIKRLMNKVEIFNINY